MLGEVIYFLIAFYENYSCYFTRKAGRRDGGRVRMEKFMHKAKTFSNRFEVGGYPLLLTGTIDSRSFDGSGIDLERRLHNYGHSIEQYICKTKFNPIVFAENSGYAFDVERFEKLATLNGKTFEFVQGTICKEEVKAHGKGYGDSLLILEGLTKSKSLKNVDYFYKMTGRIFLVNSDAIIRSCGKHRNEFISYDGIGWIMTYLFKANRNDYMNYLKDVYLETDYSELKDMEICFWTRLKHSSLDIGCFRSYPVIEGNMGESNKPYTKNKIDTLLRNLGIKMGIFTMNSFSSRIFWKTYQIITKRKPYVS